MYGLPHRAATQARVVDSARTATRLRLYSSVLFISQCFAGCLASVVATGLILLLEEKPLEAPEVDKRRMSMDPTVPLQVAPASCIPEIKQAETLIVH